MQTGLFAPLADQIYRRLFTAQALSLVGTGLTTVALALLAYELAGENAGAVLGTALALKMIAYVSIAPIVGAVAHRLPRRAFLVALDLVRAGIVLFLPFVTSVALPPDKLVACRPYLVGCQWIVELSDATA